MARRRRDPFVSQAQALSVVRYQPEVEALAQLMREAQQGYTQGVAAARGGAEATIQTIGRTRPQVERVYDVPGVNPAQVLAAPPSELPAAGSLDFRSAASFEQQAALRRIAQARADALSGLEEQKVLAAQGGQFGANQARTEFLRDAGRIQDRRASLASEIGNFVAAQTGTLRQQSAQRALQRRGQDVTIRGQTLSHADRVRGQNLSHADRQASIDARNRTSAPKLATPQQHGAFSDAVQLAVQQAKRLKAAGHNRGYIAQQLVLGRSPQTVTDPASKEKLKVPGVSKVPQLAASVGLDLLFDGHVSGGNVRRLHSRRLSVRKLGLPTAHRQISRGTGRQVANALRL